ncbi:multidrug efflux pump subunit AcrA (membrane-fusion protein) [Bradyrhizobium elkanii]|uniref:hypothetical protein n=1 Tax=Bradyrhizobium elkanii TaxID=29448 RepID=UPI0021680707|nr:hypothetical protein [Bradyrhizobium elkanii]MCS3692016.1 multidrug efflux pump subunit AcrA (membrane-fusion protein) [Bradyrhizobium elkanii]
MSDQETLAATPDGTTTTTAAPVDDGIIDLDAQPEVRDEAADEEDKGEAKPAAEEPEGDDRPKKPSGAQRAKIREQRLLSELQQREREIEELRRSAPAKTAGEGDEKAPKEEDFNGDWFAYQTAKSAYEGRQAIRDELRKDRETREASEREAKQAEVLRERNIAHAERVEDAREVIADFDQTMEAMKGVNVRNDVLEEIMSSDKSALIAYHLAKNPSELNALNSMSGRELARAMGRLEATVRMPEAKKATSAPPPLSKPKGGATPQSQEGILDAWLTKKYGKGA